LEDGHCAQNDFFYRLVENMPMLHVFEKGGFDINRKSDSGVYELTLKFKT
jgi:hypothetical protein